MSKKSPDSVKVATLKAHLSEYLRAARRGRTVVVCDRDTPIARLTPYAAPATGTPLMVREPVRSLRDVVLPAPLPVAVDSLAALLEERQSSR